MIEKLDIIKDSENCVDAFGDTHNVAGHKVINKINELVDAVNAIQKEREAERFEIQEWIGIVCDLRSRVPVVESRVSILEEHAHPTATTEPADPYAEQRKWRGKLCKFWDDSDEPENCVYDVLYNIFDLHHEYCPFQCGNGEWYEYCEPVKPDDDIIYRGE